jgi:hypothetical protein
MHGTDVAKEASDMILTECWILVTRTSPQTVEKWSWILRDARKLYKPPMVWQSRAFEFWHSQAGRSRDPAGIDPA